MRITTPKGILEGDSIEAILEEYGRDCLAGADLSGLILRNVNLGYADLRGANLHDACLSAANLYNANLSGANLRYTILHGADMTDANLHDACLRYATLLGATLYSATLTNADMKGAILRGSDMTNADLTGACLRGVNLRGVDLSYADLTDANLYDACLRGARLYEAGLRNAILSDADLSGADMTCADLTDANFGDLVGARTRILPDEGDIIGWKKAYRVDWGPIIVKLLIPADAQRSNGTGRKCRASKAQVLDLQDLDGNSLKPCTTAYSGHDPGFTYKKGETVEAEDFDTNRWTECAPGIHFFITRVEAISY